MILHFVLKINLSFFYEKTPQLLLQGMSSYRILLASR